MSKHTPGPFFTLGYSGDISAEEMNLLVKLAEDARAQAEGGMAQPSLFQEATNG